MGQILHGSATTTEAVRRAIQNSQATIRSLARQYGINPKTVAKWKQRVIVHDALAVQHSNMHGFLEGETTAPEAVFNGIHQLINLGGLPFGMQDYLTTYG